MRLTWLGHSGFRLEIGGEILLIDPWLRGNPSFDEARFDEAIKGATAILLSHGHDDHVANAPEIAKAVGAPIHGMYELVSHLAARHGIEAVGFNKGGTIRIGGVSVTLVHATHSSSTTVDGKPVYLGGECGFVISAEGRTVYFSGDTDVHADMGLIAELHDPDVGILCCGGHYTMCQKRAAFAARKFFKFKTVVPCHYKTFPLLAQDSEVLRAELPGVKLVAPEVMETVEI